MKKISEVFVLHDDESVKKKLTVMSKWDAIFDDSRNVDDFGEKVEDFLVLGKKYRITIEELE